MLQKRLTLPLAATLALCVAIYFFSYFHLKSSIYHHELTRQKNALGWHMPPFLIKMVAGEFKGIIADMVVIDIGASLGDPTIGDDQINWDNIVTQFNTAMALDPYFQQTYVLAQGLLPWRGGKVQETQQLLEISNRHRTWDWRPAYCMGFNSYYFLKDYGTAGKVLLEAGNRTQAPPFLAILGSRLATRGGETETAIVLLESMLKQRLPGDPDFKPIQMRLGALYGVLTLERAAQAYDNTFKTKPRSLDDLLTSNIIGNLPENPYGDNYCLDVNGAIHFDSVNCIKNAN